MTKMADQQTDTDSLDVFDRIIDAIVTKPQRGCPRRSSNASTPAISRVVSRVHVCSKPMFRSTGASRSVCSDSAEHIFLRITAASRK